MQVWLGFLSDVLIGAGLAGVFIRCSDWCRLGWVFSSVFCMVGENGTVFSLPLFDWCRLGWSFSEMF